MKENIEAVRQFYNRDAEKEWDRLGTRHPVEFILTTWMMDKYIRPGDSILDIGGGPGRYSIHYAKKGCAVTLVDLAEENAALARRKAAEAGVPLAAWAADCLELDRLDLGQYDHVFLMGPLYHLTDGADRVRAVETALRRLKSGGKLYVSFIMVFARVIYDLQNAGHIAADCAEAHTAAIIEAVASGRDYSGPDFTTAYFYHQRNILPFMEQFGLEKLHLFGQEGILSPHEPQLLERDAAEFDQWIALAKRYLEVPELLSWSEHAIYIGRKP